MSVFEKDIKFYNLLLISTLILIGVISMFIGLLPKEEYIVESVSNDYILIYYALALIFMILISFIGFI